MKRLTIIFEETGSDMLSCSCNNEGFSAGEMLGFLEMKKIDIIDQMLHPNMFKRQFVDKDGNRVAVVKDGEEEE